MKREVSILTEQASDGFYSAYTEAENLPFGVIGEGSTLVEAIEDFKSVFADMSERYTCQTGISLDVELIIPSQELSQVTFA